MKMLVGIDDTDSLEGMCTTYLARLLMGELEVVGFPRLIRLNPNIPYKTRGNGAVCLDVRGDPEKVKEVVLSMVETHSHLQSESTNPGVVLLPEEQNHHLPLIDSFYRAAVSRKVTIAEAERVAKKVGAQYYKFKKGRGIIGSLAAVGADLEDRTYELITYRKHENLGTPRRIVESSVFEMDRKTFPKTFDNVDYESRQVLIAPRGKDPVLFGIRGESPKAVLAASELVLSPEGIYDSVVFETNQATDAHVVPRSLNELKVYDCAILTGRVVSPPRDSPGGHVFFRFSDGSGEIDCSAYSQTGMLRETVKQLAVGDQLRVFGGIARHERTFNLEKIEILALIPLLERNPVVCCGRKMMSAGKNKGLKCRACSKTVKEEGVTYRSGVRGISEGFYEAAPRARRHLSKPIVRMVGAQL